MATFPDFLRRKQRFLLTGHENPDGDCLGAETALYHLLRALGQDVAIVNPDPIGRSFDFLLRHTPFQHARAEEPLPGFDTVVLLDCCQLSRVGALGQRLLQQRPTIAVIDHHVGSDQGDGTVCYVDAKAAATGALDRRRNTEHCVPLGPAASESEYLSLVPDTGWIPTSNTD
ncbi:MAG: DHH family phosphoesterase, partial [Planctomycetota bacterium]